MYLLSKRGVPQLQVLLCIGQDGLQRAPQVLLVEVLGGSHQGGERHGDLHLHSGKVLHKGEAGRVSQPGLGQVKPDRLYNTGPGLTRSCAWNKLCRKTIPGYTDHRGKNRSREVHFFPLMPPTPFLLLKRSVPGCSGFSSNALSWAHVYVCRAHIPPVQDQSSKFRA